MDETQSMLRQVFRTENPLTMAVSGTGSAGMEACVVNLIEPGDRMVVCVNGVFGGRMADVAGRCGAEVTKLERALRRSFSTAAVAECVNRVKPKVVGIVHAETSTGAAAADRGDRRRCVHEAGALLLMDCVTSLGVCLWRSTIGGSTPPIRGRRSVCLPARIGTGHVQPCCG